MFDNCVENDFVPKVLVMCGNFTSRSISNGNARDIQRYQGESDPICISCLIDYFEQRISIR